MNSLKTALSHIRRSPYQTVLIILVLFFSFFLLTSFAVLAFSSQKVLTFFEAKPQAIDLNKPASRCVLVNGEAYGSVLGVGVSGLICPALPRTVRGLLRWLSIDVGRSRI